ncbi:MAG: hypothetical protein L6Q69_08815 [Zoogloea sp.]|nr:hypothetical protein [Zoogloea sp.]
MKEGSALLAALALAAGIAYWSDHFRTEGWKAAPQTESPFPYQQSATHSPNPVPPPAAPERLEVNAARDAADKAALCTELQEVIDDVDAALLHPQSPSSAEQLLNRRRTYVEKRMALGC